MKVRYIFIYIYIYIYYVEKIYNYILYIVYRSLLGYIFSSESTMFTSLPPRRLRWSAGAAGQSSPNLVLAPHSRNVTSLTRQNQSWSQSGAPRLKTDLRTVIFTV